MEKRDQKDRTEGADKWLDEGFRSGKKDPFLREGAKDPA